MNNLNYANIISLLRLINEDLYNIRNQVIEIREQQNVTSARLLGIIDRLEEINPSEITEPSHFSIYRNLAPPQEATEERHRIYNLINEQAELEKSEEKITVQEAPKKRLNLKINFKDDK